MAKLLTGSVTQALVHTNLMVPHGSGSLASISTLSHTGQTYWLGGACYFMKLCHISEWNVKFQSWCSIESIENTGMLKSAKLVCLTLSNMPERLRPEL